MNERISWIDDYYDWHDMIDCTDPKRLRWVLTELALQKADPQFSLEIGHLRRDVEQFMTGDDLSNNRVSVDLQRQMRILNLRAEGKIPSFDEINTLAKDLFAEDFAYFSPKLKAFIYSVYLGGGILDAAQLIETAKSAINGSEYFSSQVNY